MVKSRLAELREDKGLTQQALANLVYVEQSTICKYESKQRKMTEEVIQRIAEALDADPNELREDQTGNTYFESGSITNGTVNSNSGVIHVQNYYHVPKELLDSIIHQQQAQTTILQVLVDKLSKVS